MWSVVPSVVVLGLVAMFAVQLARRRASPASAFEERHAASRMLGAATAIQSLHFAEEWATGFHIRFPALLGLEPMPLWFFVAFNVVWLVIWIASVASLRNGRRPALFAAWFLAIAAMLNGVAHPAMAAVSSSYFPGLISSPFIGIAGATLWRRLQAATRGS